MICGREMKSRIIFLDFDGVFVIDHRINHDCNVSFYDLVSENVGISLRDGLSLFVVPNTNRLFLGDVLSYFSEENDDEQCFTTEECNIDLSRYFEASKLLVVHYWI